MSSLYEIRATLIADGREHVVDWLNTRQEAEKFMEEWAVDVVPFGRWKDARIVEVPRPEPAPAMPRVGT